jgi:hypothetical protein
MNANFNKFVYLIGVCAAALTYTPAAAQDAQPLSDAQLGDVVATAQRREEKLQNVPTLRPRLESIGYVAQRSAFKALVNHPTV